MSRQAYQSNRVFNREWEDLTISFNNLAAIGASVPNIVGWKTVLRVYEFNAGDELFFGKQLPHSYELGEDFYVHVHWTPGLRGTAESGNTVAWKADLTVADRYTAFPSITTYDLTSTCGGVNDRHEISSDVLISGSNLNISTMIIGRIYRDTGDTWVTNTLTNRPIFLKLDFHYPRNTIGSRQIRNK